MASIAEYQNSWFAVQVWSGREQLAATQLRQRGYEVFLPCYRERRRWSDRVKEFERALFSGYLFCRMQAHAFGKIVSTTGVIRIVGGQDGPLAVEPTEVESIKLLMDTRFEPTPRPYVAEGQRVRIEAGPLRGTEGIVVKVKGETQLVLSISLLQRSVAVEVDAAVARPLDG